MPCMSENWVYCTPTPKSGGYVYPHALTFYTYARKIWYQNASHTSKVTSTVSGTRNLVGELG